MTDQGSNISYSLVNFAARNPPLPALSCRRGNDGFTWIVVTSAIFGGPSLRFSGASDCDAMPARSVRWTARREQSRKPREGGIVPYENLP